MENNLRTVELDIYTYNYFLKQENKLEIIRKIAKEKDNSYEAMLCIKAILGIKEDKEND
jgi:hypothetical protein